MFQAVERAIVAEGMCAADAASYVSVCPRVSGCRGRHGWCSLMLRMGRGVCQVLVDERLLAFECLPLATLERALDDGRLPSKYLSLGLLRLATGLRKELTQTKAQLQSAQHRLLQPYECCDPHERIGERIAVLRGSDYHQGIVLGFRAPDHRIAFDGDVNGATLVDLRQVQCTPEPGCCACHRAWDWPNTLLCCFARVPTDYTRVLAGQRLAKHAWYQRRGHVQPRRDRELRRR